MTDKALKAHPPVLTSYHSNNDHLMAEVARLFFRPGDVTFGRGRFWRKVDLSQYEFHASDLAMSPAAPSTSTAAGLTAAATGRPAWSGSSSLPLTRATWCSTRSWAPAPADLLPSGWGATTWASSYARSTCKSINFLQRLQLP